MIVRIALLLHRVGLFLLLPRALRESHGPEIRELFGQLVRDAARRGPLAPVGVLWREFLQSLREVRQLAREEAEAQRRLRPPARLDPGHLALEARRVGRSLLRHPLLASAVVLTLGVGLGLTFAVAAVARASFLAPIPVPDADRLVVVTGRVDSPAWTGRTGISARELTVLAEGSRAVEDIALFSLTGSATLTGAERPTRLRIGFVSPHFFDVVGAELARGRVFRDEEARDPSLPHLVLDYSTWVTHFGRDPEIVGRTVRLADRPYQVVGVLNEDHLGVDRAGVQVWAPLGRATDVLAPDLFESLGRGSFWAVGRLAEGSGLDQARTELRAIHDAFTRAEPLPTERTVGVMHLEDFYFQGAARPFGAVALGALLVLGICVVNVTLLLSLRMRRRNEEFEIRRAMGAGRRHLLLGLALEVGWLSTGGAIVASLVSALAVESFVARFGYALPFFSEIPAPFAHLPSQLAVSLLLTGACTGLAAGSALARVRSPRPQRRSKPLRPGTVIVTETALATVVLVLLLLGSRALATMRDQELGYDRTDLQSARVHLAGSDVVAATGSPGFAREIVERMEARTRRSAGALGPSMLGRSFSHQMATPAGLDPADPTQRFRVDWISVAPGTLAALDVQLLKGRALRWGEPTEGLVSMVVDERVARRFWADDAAVGRLIHLNGSPEPNAVVVGVAERTQHSRRSNQSYTIGAAYFSMEQLPTPSLTLLWRADEGGPGLDEVRDIVSSLDPSVALYDAAAMEERLAGEESSLRLVQLLSFVYGAIALALVVGGLVVLVAAAAHGRATELAVRQALGAGTAGLTLLVARSTLLYLASGVVVGATLASLLLRPLGTVLYGISPVDPAAYVGASLTLLALGGGAAVTQALRAVRVPPAERIRAGV